MPLNDYKCPKGHTTEYWHQLISEVTPTLECPECGEKAIKLISVPRFNLSWVAGAPQDNPWEGTVLEGGGEPGLDYKSEKVFVDHGKKTQVNGKASPQDYATQLVNLP